MSSFDYDEYAVARGEANYQTPTSRERRAFVRAQLAIDSGESVLSIGCGSGFEPAELATAESSASVIGIDVTPIMLARARERRPRDASLLRADATHFPVEDSTFDKAVSVQVYEYIEELTGALAELRCVLDEDGRAVIYATEWDSLVWQASDAERTERVLDVWDDHCVHPRLGSKLQATLQSSGFAVKNATAFPIVLTELGEDTFAGTV